ncbi:hypothetical protein TAMA11512_08600 [Selenomonas sp. TAMA-11512]|nr:hypothetical protein TAMA11512_08600 [Selenomonas sp. TAMA-11512]
MRRVAGYLRSLYRYYRYDKKGRFDFFDQLKAIAIILLTIGIVCILFYIL